ALVTRCTERLGERDVLPRGRLLEGSDEALEGRLRRRVRDKRELGSRQRLLAGPTGLGCARAERGEEPDRDDRDDRDDRKEHGQPGEPAGDLHRWGNLREKTGSGISAIPI